MENNELPSLLVLVFNISEWTMDYNLRLGVVYFKIKEHNDVENSYNVLILVALAAILFFLYISWPDDWTHFHLISYK